MQVLTEILETVDLIVNTVHILSRLVHWLIHLLQLVDCERNTAHFKPQFSLCLNQICSFAKN